jgi:hypothetical protein
MKHIFHERKSQSLFLILVLVLSLSACDKRNMDKERVKNINTTLIIDKEWFTGEYIPDSINQTYSPVWKRDTIIKSEVIEYFFLNDSIWFNTDTPFFGDIYFGRHSPLLKFSVNEPFMWSESPTGYHSYGFDIEYVDPDVLIGSGRENSQTKSISWVLSAE